MDETSGRSTISKWLIRLAVAAAAVGAVAGVRQCVLAKNEREFQEQLRQLDINQT